MTTDIAIAAYYYPVSAYLALTQAGSGDIENLSAIVIPAQSDLILGLCAARHVSSRPGMQPFVFERSQEVGGIWCYSDEIGIDEHGLRSHSSMYKNLR